MMYERAHDDFPRISDDPADLTAEQLKHFLKLKQLLDSGERITASLLYGSFRDDHIPSYNVSVFVGGEEFKMCMPYIADADLLFSLAAAPYKDTDHQQVLDYLMVYLNDISSI